MNQPRIRLDDTIVQEITRRTVESEENLEWSQYLLLLATASEILNQAPQSAAACADFDVVERTGHGFEAMIRLVHRLFPGGLKEAWHYYLPERRLPER